MYEGFARADGLRRRVRSGALKTHPSPSPPPVGRVRVGLFIPLEGGRALPNGSVSNGASIICMQPPKAPKIQMNLHFLAKILVYSKYLL